MTGETTEEYHGPGACHSFEPAMGISSLTLVFDHLRQYWDWPLDPYHDDQIQASGHPMTCCSTVMTSRMLA